jgi:hypothetical protein
MAPCDGEANFISAITDGDGFARKAGVKPLAL